MTNKLFIVKYVFIVDIDKDKNKNFDINLDKREDFDETIDFDANVVQNICFFNVANNVANKINSIKLDFSSVANEIKIIDEIKEIWIIASFFAKNVANRFW